MAHKILAGTEQVQLKALPHNPTTKKLYAKLLLNSDLTNYTKNMRTDFEKKFLCIFGGRIAAARKDAGWTQRELAEKIGIAPTYIASIETGRRWPHLNIICDVAKILKTTPYALVMGIEAELTKTGAQKTT